MTQKLTLDEVGVEAEDAAQVIYDLRVILAMTKAETARTKTLNTYDELMTVRLSADKYEVFDHCCQGKCCGPGSWCCAHAGEHEHKAPPTTARPLSGWTNGIGTPVDKCSHCGQPVWAAVTEVASGQVTINWRHDGGGSFECGSTTVDGWVSQVDKLLDEATEGVTHVTVRNLMSNSDILSAFAAAIPAAKMADDLLVREGHIR